VPNDRGEIGRALGGRYRLVTHIGTGRFTNVYLAYDLSQSRRVAVKLLSEDILPDRWIGEGAFVGRFLEAAEEAAAVSHPHVVAAHNWGDSDLGLYVVSDYMEGGSLLGMMDAGHLLSPSQVLMVGLDAVRGLEHIHDQGIIHGDIHELWIDPDDPSRMILGNDGGIAFTYDRGRNWRFVENLPFAQFYHIEVDNEIPFNVFRIKRPGGPEAPEAGAVFAAWSPTGSPSFHVPEAFRPLRLTP